MTDNAQVKILPPVIPAIAVFAGWAIHALLPMEILSSGVLLPVGVALVAVSIVIVVAALAEIAKAKTAFDVRKPTTSLVTKGIFSFTRNPTYLSMMFLSFGIALMANSLPIFLTTILAGSGLCLMVIRREEVYLATKFGDEYQNYSRSVRRWI